MGQLKIRASVTILRVTQNGETRVSTVDPQLVGPSCHGLQCQLRDAIQPLQNTIFRDAFLAIGSNLPQQAGKLLPGDGRIDDAGIFLRAAANQRMTPSTVSACWIWKGSLLYFCSRFSACSRVNSIKNFLLRKYDTIVCLGKKNVNREMTFLPTENSGIIHNCMLC